MLCYVYKDRIFYYSFKIFRSFYTYAGLKNNNCWQNLNEIKQKQLELGIYSEDGYIFIRENGEPINPNDWAEFYEALPGKDRVEIQKCFEFTNNVPMVPIICPKCGAQRMAQIPMDRDFFRLS